MDELYIDGLSGEEFENYLFNLFKNLGYEVESTPASNDYGADLVIAKGAERTVVQAKRYSNTVGISAIQEVVGAKNYYQANKCMVVTTNYFTPNAVELAKTSNVELWDRDVLIKMIALSLGSNPDGDSKNTVSFQEILNSAEYKNINSRIPLILGKTALGKILVTTIDEMPHLLITGATGTGKSMFLHTLIAGILYKSSHQNVKLLLIDPKIVEFSIYNGAPQLLLPAITDLQKAISALNWTVAEMERRYELFAKNNVRDIDSYNGKFKDNEDEIIPDIVIIIDELAELNIDEAKAYIDKLTQMGRATGIYLIATTQIPNIANTFKNNFPSRIAFRVFSQSDSRLAINTTGAEKLFGKGDMLFYPINELKPIRIQSAFIDEEDIRNITRPFKEQSIDNYHYNYNDYVANNFLHDTDELLMDAISLVIEEEQASISLLQRKFKIDYARAARLIDEMEIRGIVGSFEGSKPRKVLINKDDLMKLINMDFNSHYDIESKNKYDYYNNYKLHKKSKIFRTFISFVILLIIANFTIVKIENPAVGFPVLFFITFVSFKLGSWITNKLLNKQKN
ncbi:FtsK/SpoIIIE domain-containing protein [Clostridium sp. Cult3]|uniref:FtsK/SpoIIIE domain-containing protein n=1 Tax=Clostridium sp. Cult3 TaxID=2079004 RepID=UPI001F0259D3|nr:FtsK/SpoIIIE domain-containing protein [Clostridium sp. Cult3]MCF6461459.1 hypothetical protein [Clostridium sp. Cult3]